MVSICHVFRWFLGWGYCLVDTNTQLVFLKFAEEMVKGDEDKKLFANISSRFAIHTLAKFCRYIFISCFFLSPPVRRFCVYDAVYSVRFFSLLSTLNATHNNNNGWLCCFLNTENLARTLNVFFSVSVLHTDALRLINIQQRTVNFLLESIFKWVFISMSSKCKCHCQIHGK